MYVVGQVTSFDASGGNYPDDGRSASPFTIMMGKARLSNEAVSQRLMAMSIMEANIVIAALILVTAISSLENDGRRYSELTSAVCLRPSTTRRYTAPTARVPRTLRSGASTSAS